MSIKCETTRTHAQHTTFVRSFVRWHNEFIHSQMCTHTGTYTYSVNHNHKIKHFFFRTEVDEYNKKKIMHRHTNQHQRQFFFDINK